MAGDVDVGRDKRFIQTSTIPLQPALIEIFFRIIFIRDFTIKSLRVKPEKWSKLCSTEEQKFILLDFVEGGENPPPAHDKNKVS